MGDYLWIILDTLSTVSFLKDTLLCLVNYNNHSMYCLNNKGQHRVIFIVRPFLAFADSHLPLQSFNNMVRIGNNLTLDFYTFKIETLHSWT